MNNILTQLPTYQQILFGVLVVMFVIQIIYWLWYSKIAKYRSPNRVAAGEQLPAVSVVVIIDDNQDYIVNGLPLLLEQEHPEFEVVVVNDCGGPDIDDELTKLTRTYPHLRFTTFKEDIKFSHSRKIPLVVGLKAARFENIIIVDSDAVPTNEKWLSYMCRGFSGGELVIGYTGFEIVPGLANRIARCTRLTTSIRYLRKAINDRPYRGIYNNIGYTKKLFFDNRGFTNLAMTIGEDDLFVQKIAPRCSTSVIINPQSTLRQESPPNMARWWDQQRYLTYSFRYYPLGVKLNTFTELASRALFFSVAIAVGVLCAMQLVAIPYVWAGVVALFLLRELTLILSIRKITARLGEPKIIVSYVLYDLIAPAIETIVAISRRINPPKHLWIQNSKK